MPMPVISMGKIYEGIETNHDLNQVACSDGCGQEITEKEDAIVEEFNGAINQVSPDVTNESGSRDTDTADTAVADFQAAWDISSESAGLNGEALVNYDYKLIQQLRDQYSKKNKQQMTKYSELLTKKVSEYRKYEDYSADQIDKMKKNFPEYARMLIKDYRSRSPVDYSLYKDGEIPTEIKVQNILDQIPSRYHQDFVHTYEQAGKDEALIFERYVNNAEFDSITCEGRSYFSFKTKGININIDKSYQDVKGPFYSIFHEYGHYVDFMGSSENERWGTVSANDAKLSREFNNAIMKDYHNYIIWQRKRFKQEHGANYFSENDFKNYIWNDLYDDELSSVSDIIDGASKGKYQGKYWHCREVDDGKGHVKIDNSYWLKPGNLQREAFAHFFEANMSADKQRLRNINRIFPNAALVYRKIINKMKG